MREGEMPAFSVAADWVVDPTPGNVKLEIRLFLMPLPIFVLPFAPVNQRSKSVRACRSYFLRSTTQEI
jgi:hypothetical protein